MGYPRKPTKLKILQGNPGKRALNKNEPEFKTCIPEAPSYLYGDALKEWDNLAKLLASKGLLSEADAAELANYCLCIQEIAEATEDIKQNGFWEKTTNGNMIQRPSVGTRHQAMDRCHKFLIQFGMTPASRSSISADTLENKEDPFAILI